MSEAKSNRRRRVSRSKKKVDDDQHEEDEVLSEKEETISSKKRTLELEQPKSVALVQQKKTKVEEDTGAEEDDEKKEWGSKQPKFVDQDILKYALTTGGEIAKKMNELKQLEARLAEEKEKAENTLQDRIEEESEAVMQLRNALFKEIREGEASLACDKRGSKVLQALVKESSLEQACRVFERVKPYIGHLLYDISASHVMQALVERCSAEDSTAKSHLYVSELCDSVSKVNEWWAMMHDTCGTYAARTCVSAMAKINDHQGLDKVFESLKTSSQADFRSAARNPQAGPFLIVAINSMYTTDMRQTLLRRLFSDERNDVALDRKQFDSCIQDKISSRVVDQTIGNCSSEFVTDFFLNQGFVSPFLLRSARHPFGNFVIQRVIEKLEDRSSLEDRVMKECPAKDLIDFDRAGVLTSIAKALSKSKDFVDLQKSFVQTLVEAKIIEKATSRVSTHSSEQSVEEERAPRSKEVQVHMALAETLFQIFSNFSKKSVVALIDSLLALEKDKLVKLACDPVGGKKLIEPILDSKSDKSKDLARMYSGRFDRLVLDHIGVHVARKAFQALPLRDKIAVLDKEIVPSKNKFAGTNHANKFFTQVGAGRFAVNKKEWIKREEEAEAEAGEASGGKKSKKARLRDEFEKDLGL